MYPSNAFNLLLAVGLLITRRRRQRLNIPSSGYQAWTATVGFAILSSLYMLVAPWYPPSTGADGGDVSFWYATYCVVGLAMYVLPLSPIYRMSSHHCPPFHPLKQVLIDHSVALCGAYYYIWIKVLPRLGRYEFRQTQIQVDEDATANKLVKVPVDRLEEWDREHDALGRVRQRAAARTASNETGEIVYETKA